MVCKKVFESEESDDREGHFGDVIDGVRLSGGYRFESGICDCRSSLRGANMNWYNRVKLAGGGMPALRTPEMERLLRSTFQLGDVSTHPGSKHKRLSGKLKGKPVNVDIPMGVMEVTPGTFKNILTQLGINRDEFMLAWNYPKVFQRKFVYGPPVSQIGTLQGVN